jgi:stage III sporulation protein AG
MQDNNSSSANRYMNMGPKKIRVIFIAGLIGVGLLAIPGFFENSKAGNAVPEERITVNGDEYLDTNHLEERLVQLVESIQGAGSAKVMVTLQSGTEYVYATEDRKQQTKSDDGTRKTSQDDTQQKLILVSQSGGGQAPIILKKIPATVMGVAILCDGAQDSQVRLNIIQAVTTLLDIPSNRVCIMKKS